MKIYNHFTDKFGNDFRFENYLDFATFWFGMHRKTAISLFPNDFKKLQNAATKSKEAKRKFISIQK